MTESKNSDTQDQPTPAKTPLNLNDLASNPMRVGMARLGKRKRPQAKSKKKHWWSRRTK
ncbi:hypothetical protein ACFP1H_11005 [Secundilactobacillus hailunensis]|uniref:Uncharacterized protein n=1 Tax=Secundilactobacillus hailunensis TaxID=2559923 RepID=A0ABW1TCK9_9LACO|nr:hypothetical protein [Secundilactobacillus hailunensis]